MCKINANYAINEYFFNDDVMFIMGSMNQKG